MQDTIIIIPMNRLFFEIEFKDINKSIKAITDGEFEDMVIKEYICLDDYCDESSFKKG